MGTLCLLPDQERVVESCGEYLHNAEGELTAAHQVRSARGALGVHD